MSKMISLLPKLQGQVLEISVGDEYEELLSSDGVKKVNGVIYGRLIDIIDEFLEVDCFYVDKETNTVQNGNIVYINTWQIKAFTRVKYKGCLNDAFLSSAHARKIKSLLGIDE